MARLRKDDTGERRTAFVGFYVTPAEQAELVERAASVGRSLSDFARIVLLSDLKRPAPNARDPRSIKALAAEIARVGNNLNQLARIANERRAVPPERELRDVAELVKSAISKVIAL